MISPIVLNWVRGVGSGSSYDPQCLVQDAITLYLTCSHGVPQKPAWCERMREYGIVMFASLLYRGDKNVGCILTFPNVATIDGKCVYNTSLYHRPVPPYRLPGSAVLGHSGRVMLYIHIRNSLLPGFWELSVQYRKDHLAMAGRLSSSSPPHDCNGNPARTVPNGLRSNVHNMP